MAEREKKKSLKERAQEVVQGVVQGAIDAVESLFPAPQQLIPIPVTSRPAPRRRR